MCGADGCGNGDGVPRPGAVAGSAGGGVAAGGAAGGRDRAGVQFQPCTPPDVVVLDEPTSSLDGHLAAALLAHVRRFVAAGGAVVFISHKLNEVLSVADRAVVMRDGSVVAEMPAAGTMTRDGLVAAMGHAVGPALRARRAAVDGPMWCSRSAGLRRGGGRSWGSAGWRGMGRRSCCGGCWAAAGCG